MAEDREQSSCCQQMSAKSNRILVIDDEPKIVQVYLKILDEPPFEFRGLEELNLPKQEGGSPQREFVVATAAQGEEGVALVEDAAHRGAICSCIYRYSHAARVGWSRDGKADS
jgi:CheY-like chemotaxis protein